MKKEIAEKAERLNFEITQQEILVEDIENAFSQCTQDQTDVYWSAYGGLELERDGGWGRNDVGRLLIKERNELKKLEKELEDL